MTLFLGTPITGRTHQIRVHLQWLGHAIVNDPIYNVHKSNYDESFRIIYEDDDDDAMDASSDVNMTEPWYICLHAWQYRSLDVTQPWHYRTELPHWAKEE